MANEKTQTALLQVKRRLKMPNDEFWKFIGKDCLVDLTEDEARIKLIELCTRFYKNN